jgi:hypothetical protein
VRGQASVAVVGVGMWGWERGGGGDVAELEVVLD